MVLDGTNKSKNGNQYQYDTTCQDAANDREISDDGGSPPINTDSDQ